jgi:hypothetical protein
MNTYECTFCGVTYRRVPQMHECTVCGQRAGGGWFHQHPHEQAEQKQQQPTRYKPQLKRVA